MHHRPFRYRSRSTKPVRTSFRYRVSRLRSGALGRSRVFRSAQAYHTTSPWERRLGRGLTEAIALEDLVGAAVVPLKPPATLWRDKELGSFEQRSRLSMRTFALTTLGGVVALNCFL